jgi:rfaE bifunctional protein kinase chain/domain
MNATRFQEITSRYRQLRIGVVGDFCLDRYLEIDPAKEEISIETGLPVHNVANVRSQPGAAGTILNNLVALGIGDIFPIGFCGRDAEGFELLAALNDKPGVRLEHLLQTTERRTFAYCKPLVLKPGEPPRELNRLDMKNWSPTPDSVLAVLRESFRCVVEECDAIILMDQVDVPDTGVLTSDFLDSVSIIARARPEKLMLGDSRRSLCGWPAVCLKMNQAELSVLTGGKCEELGEVRERILSLTRAHTRPVFVTLAERGVIGASPAGEVVHVPAHPVRGTIDIVGAGDAVTANLAAALAAGAGMVEALELAMAAASVVIHQLGTTGTATTKEIGRILLPSQ